jgi:hypothetical protein
MADWKKVVVSGSVISQLENDAGYVASVGAGILSASAEGSSQGQIELNGVDVDINGLGTAGTPTFASVTASLKGDVVGNVTGDVTGDLTGTADTASYVDVGNIDGEITATTASHIAVSSTGQGLVSVGDTANVALGLETTDDVTFNTVTADLTGTADTASYVAFSGVDGLTSFSSSVASQLIDTAFNLSVGADSGTDDVIADGDTLNFEGGANVTTTVSDNNIKVDLDDAISLTSVTASLKGDVVGNVTGDVTGDLTGNADTATALETARLIGGTSFDGTADITPDNANTASYVAVADIDGDIVAVTASLALAAETLKAGATGVDLTLTGDLTVQGTTTTIETTNLNVEDQFINLNDGGGAADGGIVVEGAGTSFGWSNSAGRWAFDYSGATEGQTTITSDAYAAAVVTSDDANYQKNGNIRVQSGDIYIYVE